KLRSSALRLIPRSLLPKPMINDFTSDEQLFACQAEIIRQLAESESCVIVGKCADYVLKDYDNVISLYIEASRPYCVNRVMKSMGVSEKEANHIITATDKYRADYYKHYTNGNYWTNPINYDFTINIERVGRDNCISEIKHYLSTKFGIDINPQN
ncbi:MAG: cytidylate kinase-like family protein, partial [Clostridiales bacterium]|nr:cytidylate kinase-like family protein [Clostridiales bacterium]